MYYTAHDKTACTTAFSILIVLIMAMISDTASVLAQTKFIERKAGHIFYLSVPEYMQRTRDLNETASLQYKNSRKEAYCIVIEDSKDQLRDGGISFTNINTYAEQLLKAFAGKLTKVKTSKPVPITTKSGLKGMQAEITGTIDGVNSVYLCTYIETEQYLYQIICWTLQDRKKELFADYQKIVQSLRE